MIVIAILGVLAAIAVPNYMQYLERTRYTIAVTMIRQIDKQLNMFLIENNSYPENLMQIGLGNLKDPWGNPYQYLNLITVSHKDKNKIRKDHSLHPVNSDFDLYSMGPDGTSKAPFTAKHSRDDIVRASDGRFVGRVTDY